MYLEINVIVLWVFNSNKNCTTLETRADNFRFVTKLSEDFFTKLTIPDVTYISELFNDVNNNKKGYLEKRGIITPNSNVCNTNKSTNKIHNRI